LRDALEQTDLFIENKVLVPKNKSVIYSHDMIFFYADRKYRTVNFANVNMGFRNFALSPSFIGATTLNPTALIFHQVETIGRERFNIRGVIVLQTPPTGEAVVTGCSASIVMKTPTGPTYMSYNPALASLKHQVHDGISGATYVSNPPIAWIPENADNVGFWHSAYARGCIFFYTKE
jgi:hypothetical protein